MKETKEWSIQGFDEEIEIIIDEILMKEEISYWFRFRTISWYRIRRIKGLNPIKTIERALKEQNIEAKVWKKNQLKSSTSIWVIEPKKKET
ncbi:MAG: hypothetical protein ACFFAU_12425 [Candidatus Hodarchaeota archaeon]